jgi:hypothetical protein
MRFARTSSLIASLSLSFSLAATEASAEVTADEIAAALSGYEHTAPADVVRGWSERSVSTLVQLAEDPQRPEFVRARAAAAIKSFAPSPLARTALVRLATATAHPLVLRAALDGLCVEFGDLAIAQRFLSANVSDHREAAAWSIARSGRSEARAMLARARESERDPALQATLTLTARELERVISAAQRGAITSRVVPTVSAASVARASRPARAR